MDLKSVTQISASGLKAQSLRMRVIAENLANADSLASTTDGDPYRRKLVVFRPNAVAGGEGVKVERVVRDAGEFERIYEPGHPAADAQGYVKQANVSSLIESTDMKSAQRSYEANLNAIEAARGMTLRTIDLLK